MRSPIDQKSLAIILAASIVLTSGNIWMHRNDPPVNWATTEQNGIKFSHPLSVVIADNTPPEWTLSYWEGGLQGEYSSDGVELLGLFWLTDRAESEELALELVLDMALQENPGLGWGDVKTRTMSGYDVTFYEIELEIERMIVPGVITAFKDPYGRIIMPFYLKSPGSIDYSLQMVERIIGTMELSAPLELLVMPSYWPTEGWKYATPAQMGLDPGPLQDMVDAIEASSFRVDSAMVIKDGYIVLDEYFGDYEKDELHIIYSCTKSVVSTIFGIAYGNGLIPDLDTRLLDIYPDIIPENPGEWKDSITLRDLLMMSGGFDARDSWIYEWEGLDGLHAADDAVEYMLDLSMDFEPGTRFEYTNGVSHLLSCIISEQTGVSAAEYAEEHLFGPLGINEYTWDTDNRGRNWGYNRIYFTPHDMAKIGFLFLNNGEWDGEQIISEDWVSEATAHRIDANILDGYGYQWWVGEDYYLALGYQGQFIFVYPEHDLIIVFTSSSPEAFDYAINLPERYVIPALD